MPDNKKAIGKRKKNNPSNLPKGTNFLLTIGIDDYVHCPKLNNAVKDTRDIANVLLEKYEFEATHHLKLENKEATKDNIIELFREIKNKATEKDNVLIYYSGHGKLNEDEESFWIPVDARENKEGDFISVDKLFRLLKVIKSHHILLILDSCFSGSMLSANTSRSLNKNEIQPSRYGIASGRRELVSDGQPGHNSPFADSLIKKLTINSDSLGASDLAQEVMRLTEAATNQNQSPLHGRMNIKGDKLGEFFFHPKKENKEETLEATVVLEKTILTPTKHIIKHNNVFTDARDGQEYKTVKLKDGKYWMAQNLNFKSRSGSWYYNNNNASKNTKKFGRLYNWEAAMQACPDGWHLPTDDEWWEMANCYGKVKNAKLEQTKNISRKNGRAPYQNLIEGGKSNFEGVHSGERHIHGSYADANIRGYYWSSSKAGESASWAYQFHYKEDKSEMERILKNIEFGLSIRCIQE